MIYEHRTPLSVNESSYKPRSHIPIKSLIESSKNTMIEIPPDSTKIGQRSAQKTNNYATPSASNYKSNSLSYSPAEYKTTPFQPNLTGDVGYRGNYSSQNPSSNIDNYLFDNEIYSKEKIFPNEVIRHRDAQITKQQPVYSASKYQMKSTGPDYSKYSSKHAYLDTNQLGKGYSYAGEGNDTKTSTAFYSDSYKLAFPKKQILEGIQEVKQPYNASNVSTSTYNDKSTVNDEYKSISYQNPYNSSVDGEDYQNVFYDGGHIQSSTSTTPSSFYGIKSFVQSNKKPNINLPTLYYCGVLEDDDDSDSHSDEDLSSINEGVHERMSLPPVHTKQYDPFWAERLSATEKEQGDLAARLSYIPLNEAKVEQRKKPKIFGQAKKSTNCEDLQRASV